jgi:hypothetical protein
MALSQYIFTASAGNLGWYAAEAQAQALGGHLASVATAEENSFVLAVLNDPGKLQQSLWGGDPLDAERNGPWIGLAQPNGSSEPGGSWGWWDFTPMTETFWLAGQPDDSDGGNSGLYLNSAGTIGWADTFEDPVSVGAAPVHSFLTELDGLQIVLKGTTEDDLIFGGAIDNQLRGTGGNDWLDGGGGADTLNGGGGKDRFNFDSAEFADGDHIRDASDRDKINLSSIDANDRKAGDQRFQVVSAFDGHAAELTISFDGTNTSISGDTDGDEVADFTITAAGDLTGFSGFFL